MSVKSKVLIIVVVVSILIVSIIMYNWTESRHSEESPSAMLEAYPENFTVYEGGSIAIILKFESDRGMPISSDIEWQISATGDTGRITYPPDMNTTATNSSGMLSVTYHAPEDVDVMNLSIKRRYTKVYGNILWFSQFWG